MKNFNKFLGNTMVIMLVFVMVFTVSYAANNNELNNNKINVLIRFENTPGQAEKALVRAFGGEIKYSYTIIPSIAASIPEQAMSGLKRNPMISVIEPDIKAYAIGTFSEELDTTWGLERIGEEIAHNNGYFGSAIKVAVIDSGIDDNHPELSENYIGGYDFVNGDTNPLDIDGHGTHVSGTIGAIRNGENITGGAPEVKLYALKALENGSGYFSDIIAALQWSVDNKINITNNSYGSSIDPGTQVKEAFDNSYASGILHVSSAGNSGNPAGKGDNVGYPGKYESVIAVGASDQNDNRAKFSSTGPDVELIAPGVDIYSTWINNSYKYLSGTSMASPHVAAVAAQVWATDPSLKNNDIRTILRNTAENIGMSPNQQGYGLIRADLATNNSFGTTQYELIMDQIGEGNITPAVGIHSYEDGVVVDLDAVPADGYVFEKWIINAIEVSEASTSITMDSNINATAYFVSESTDTNLNISVVTDKYLYSGNSWVYVTATVLDNGNPVSNINVNMSIFEPITTEPIVTDSILTDENGQAQFKYRVSKLSIKGIYTINVKYESYEASTAFEVE